MDTHSVSTLLEARRGTIAENAIARQYADHPELIARHGPAGRERALEDSHFNLRHLSQAIALGKPVIFLDYTAWLKILLMRRRVSMETILDHYRYLAEEIREELDPEPAATACECIDQAARLLPEMPEDLPSFIEGEAPVSLLAHRYLHSLLRGDRHTAAQLVHAAADGGMPVRKIYLGVFQTAQREIGRLWQTNRISVAQEHFCTAATQLVMSQLYPRVFSTEKHGRTLVATCVAGNLHELGVRMVADFFEMDGWNTYYLGANTPHESVAATLAERHADVLAISATLPYHVEPVRELIRVVRENPACAGVKILVGGPPFSGDPELWRQVGADGTAPDAQQAIDLANSLLEEAP